jgi:tRNA U34 2-thiouridine synthase MnmA/TrmU
MLPQHIKLIGAGQGQSHVSLSLSSNMLARNRSIAKHKIRCRLFAAGSCTNGRFRSNARSHQNETTKVVVAMSGGVDSSVAAYILKNLSDASVEVSGLHMSNWNALDEDADDASHTKSDNKRRRGVVSSKNDDTYSAPIKQSRQGRSSSSAFCEASEKEYNDSQSVCQHLSIPLHRVSFASEYWIQVFEPFVESLSSPTPSLSDNNGITTRGEFTMPNPDFSCNSHIKFGAMKDYAMNNLSADFVATGHYAQLWHRGCDFSSKQMQQKKSKFFEWMIDNATKLEDQVNEAVAGRPEAEWLLRSNNAQPRPMLLAGADKAKDQTYFLSGVKTDNFRHVIFPLGNLEKRQTNEETLRANRHRQSVRDIAIQAKIPTATKKDSMGICFIGKRNFGRFVSQYLAEAPQPGPFVDVDTGEIVGRHQGSVHYTIGQGAKISGASTKYFVCGKGAGDDNTNTVFVCNDTHHPSLYTDELLVEFSAFNWIGLEESYNDNVFFSPAPMPLMEGRSIEVLARTRHLQPLVPCTVSWQRRLDDSNGNLCVRFHKPMRAVTPGQILALYTGLDGLICLGGGPILSRGESLMERGLSVSLPHPSGHNDLTLQVF